MVGPEAQDEFVIIGRSQRARNRTGIIGYVGGFIKEDFGVGKPRLGHNTEVRRTRGKGYRDVGRTYVRLQQVINIYIKTGADVPPRQCHIIAVIGWGIRRSVAVGHHRDNQHSPRVIRYSMRNVAGGCIKAVG